MWRLDLYGYLCPDAGASGGLKLFGNTSLASGSNFLVGLAGTTAGTQYGQLIIKPGASMSGLHDTSIVGG